MSTISIGHNYPYRDQYIAHCENCGLDTGSDFIEPIHDAEQRLEPGRETPAGECPDCGALVWVIKEEKMSIRTTVGTLISAAIVRRDQWKAVANGELPGNVVDELYEASGSDLDKCKTECQDMADLLTKAIDRAEELMAFGEFDD